MADQAEAPALTAVVLVGEKVLLAPIGRIPVAVAEARLARKRAGRGDARRRRVRARGGARGAAGTAARGRREIGLASVVAAGARVAVAPARLAARDGAHSVHASACRVRDGARLARGTSATVRRILRAHACASAELLPDGAVDRPRFGERRVRRGVSHIASSARSRVATCPTRGRARLGGISLRDGALEVSRTIVEKRVAARKWHCSKHGEQRDRRANETGALHTRALRYNSRTARASRFRRSERRAD